MLKGGLFVFIACTNKLRLEECVVQRKQVVVVCTVIIFILSSADKNGCQLGCSKCTFLKAVRYTGAKPNAATYPSYSLTLDACVDILREEKEIRLLFYLQSTLLSRPSHSNHAHPPQAQPADRSTSQGRCWRGQFLLLRSSPVRASERAGMAGGSAALLLGESQC